MNGDGAKRLSKRICFVLTETGGMAEVMERFDRFHPNGQRVLNRTEWMGKEPRSCAVTSTKVRPHFVGDTAPLVTDIEVSYRPKGYINYVGNTRYDGWTAMVLDRKQDGTLLDGHGQPLKDGDPEVYLPYEMFHDIEFSELDFGEFVGEFDVGGVKHVTHASIMQRLTAGGFSSGRAAFIAPHRYRPEKKIVLSGQPTGQIVDGFGTHFLNIFNQTPNLEQVVMQAISDLMCEFIEGKSSISNTTFNDVTFVQLSQLLVDCAPNEDGLDSLFGILHLQTPAHFLDELARRLMSIYRISVDVVDGENGGLLLQHEVENAN